MREADFLARELAQVDREIARYAVGCPSPAADDDPRRRRHNRRDVDVDALTANERPGATSVASRRGRDDAFPDRTNRCRRRLRPASFVLIQCVLGHTPGATRIKRRDPATSSVRLPFASAHPSMRRNFDDLS